MQSLRLHHMRMVCCAIALLAVTPVYGQNITGTFSGTVSDANKAAIAGAKVNITNAATGVSVFTGTNDEEGLCIVAGLPVGVYNFAFEAHGMVLST